MQQVTLKKEKQSFQAREAYKMLRTNIEFSGADKKVFVVTSCIPGEGKSTTSYQMSLSFAQKGKKTLLIDADLRKSMMQRFVESGSVRHGLTSFLVGKQKLMDVLTGTDEPNLFIIFAGYVPPNPSELLGSTRFESMLEAAKKTFDVIIIDTPPVGTVIDSAVVSSHADGVIMVIHQGTVSYQLARRVKEQLESSGGKIIGVVLNGVDRREGGYYGSYYGKKYGSYGYGDYYGIKDKASADDREDTKITLPEK